MLDKSRPKYSSSTQVDILDFKRTSSDLSNTKHSTLATIEIESVCYMICKDIFLKREILGFICRFSKYMICVYDIVGDYNDIAKQCRLFF